MHLDGDLFDLVEGNIWRLLGAGRFCRLREEADACRNLVKRGAGAGTASAGSFIVDYASLIGTEHALPRRPDHLGSPSDQIADRGNEAVTRPHKRVAAFRPLSEEVIQQ